MDGAERWRILRLHVEDEIPLAVLARDTKISLRTLERWHRLFQEGGIAALDPRPRVDAGSRRTAAETVAFIERLALTKPRPSLATLHRLAMADARQRNAPAPGYSTVRDIVTALDPGLVTLALEGPASYRDRHELVYRRRAERPNQIWQADHTELDILIIGANGKPGRRWLTAVVQRWSCCHGQDHHLKSPTCHTLLTLIILVGSGVPCLPFLGSRPASLLPSQLFRFWFGPTPPPPDSASRCQSTFCQRKTECFPASAQSSTEDLS